MLPVEFTHNPDNPARSVMMGGVKTCKEPNTHLYLPEKQEKTYDSHSLPRMLPYGWRIGWCQGNALPMDGTPRWTGLASVYKGAVNDKADECAWWARWLDWCTGACVPALGVFATGINTERVGYRLESACVFTWCLWCLVFANCVCTCVELSMAFKVLSQTGWLFTWMRILKMMVFWVPGAQSCH